MFSSQGAFLPGFGLNVEPHMDSRIPRPWPLSRTEREKQLRSPSNGLDQGLDVDELEDYPLGGWSGFDRNGSVGIS